MRPIITEFAEASLRLRRCKSDTEKALYQVTFIHNRGYHTASSSSPVDVSALREQMRKSTEPGKDLYLAIFRDQVEEEWRSLYQCATPERPILLRIVLDMADDRYAEVAFLRWEALSSDPGGPLALDNRIMLVRTISGPGMFSPLAAHGDQSAQQKRRQQEGRRVAIRAFHASPLGLEPLRPDDIRGIQEAFRGCAKVVDVSIGGSSSEDLSQKEGCETPDEMRAERIVFHLTAHGLVPKPGHEASSVAGDGISPPSIVLQGAADRPIELVSGKYLAQLLSPLAIDLVVVASCHGADEVPDRAGSRSLAADLIAHQRNISAVLAFSGPIPDQPVSDFLSRMYELLAQGELLPCAVQGSRHWLKHVDSNNHRNQGTQWESPVLFLQSEPFALLPPLPPQSVLSAIPGSFGWVVGALVLLLGLGVVMIAPHMRADVTWESCTDSIEFQLAGTDSGSGIPPNDVEAGEVLMKDLLSGFASTDLRLVAAPGGDLLLDTDGMPLRIGGAEHPISNTNTVAPIQIRVAEGKQGAGMTLTSDLRYPIEFKSGRPGRNGRISLRAIEDNKYELTITPPEADVSAEIQMEGSDLTFDQDANSTAVINLYFVDELKVSPEDVAVIAQGDEGVVRTNTPIYLEPPEGVEQEMAVTSDTALTIRWYTQVNPGPIADPGMAGLQWGGGIDVGKAEAGVNVSNRGNRVSEFTTSSPTNQGSASARSVVLRGEFAVPKVRLHDKEICFTLTGRAQLGDILAYNFPALAAMVP